MNCYLVLCCDFSHFVEKHKYSFLNIYDRPTSPIVNPQYQNVNLKTELQDYGIENSGKNLRMTPSFFRNFPASNTYLHTLVINL